MNDAKIDEYEAALRKEHHSEVRWTHAALSEALNEIRALRAMAAFETIEKKQAVYDAAIAQRERDDYYGAHKLAKERIGKLEAALQKIVRHQPWPGDDRSEGDFNEAKRLISKAL